MDVDLARIASQLCASLFSGGEIEHARAHSITTPFVVAEHAHDDLVQFDWIVNCRGRVTIDGQTTPLAGSCAFALAPARCRHGMMLEPIADTSCVYHTRLRIAEAVRRSLRFKAIVVTPLPMNPSLEAALTDVWRLTVGGIQRPLLRAARMAEAIALWPSASDDAAGSTLRTSQGLDRDLEAALQLIERSLHAPPTLDALADAAHLSVRHFTRRFRETLGVPPIEFLERKRLALAQQMLAYESATIGEVSDRMGFSSPAVFSRWFANLARETPSAYRSRPHQL